MDQDNAPFQIHVHGDIMLRNDVDFDTLEVALKPLWKYTGARSLAGGAESFYESEPGIQFDPQEHVLHMSGRWRATRTSACSWTRCA